MQKQTRICAFMAQKGGVGKSVLTNMISNEIILWHLQNTGDKVRALVVDVDPQQTCTAKRIQDVRHLEFTEEKPEFQHLPEEQKTEVARLQRRYALLQDAGFAAYKLLSVDSTNSKQIDAAFRMIQSGEYDYAFIDFPGTLSQEGTGAFLKLVQHLFVPMSINPSDVLGTECFLEAMAKLPFKFTSVNIVWNRFEVARLRKTNKTEQELLSKYHIPFLKNRIPYSPLNDCNTLIPASLNVNLNMGSYSIVKSYLQNLAEEIITIADK